MRAAALVERAVPTVEGGIAAVSAGACRVRWGCNFADQGDRTAQPKADRSWTTPNGGRNGGGASSQGRRAGGPARWRVRDHGVGTSHADRPAARHAEWVEWSSAWGGAAITWFEAGADVVLRTDGPLSLDDRTRLERFSRETGLVRLCWARGGAAPELVWGLGDAVVWFAGAAVPVPPGAFLQASAEGEEAIVEAVLAGLPRRGCNA